MAQGRFHDQTAVVTGAGGGLGKASAMRLADEGAAVVVVDIDGEAAARTAAELSGPAIAVQADVSSEDDVARYMREAKKEFGAVHLHHLNAGIFGDFAFLPDVEVAEFDRVMAVNVRGQFIGMRAAFREYRDSGTRGSLALTASIASLTGSGDLFPYHVSKHAVIGMVRSGAVYGGPLGIRVNAVAPGIVPTDLFRAAADTAGGGNDMARRASTTPLRRAGSAEEIAAVVAFLLSEDAAYVTGQVYAADGGASIVNTVRPYGGAGAWDTEAVDQRTYQGFRGH